MNSGNYFNTILSITLFVAVIALQIILSKNDDKRFGLILPGITLSLSIIISSIYLFSAMNLDSNIIIGLFIVLLGYNVPTILFYCIYLVCRKYKNNINSRTISMKR